MALAKALPVEMATGGRASGHVWNDRHRTNVDLDHDLDADADSKADSGSGSKAVDDRHAVETPWGCG